ncbi:MAG: tyrosine-type recombinase/integrase [Blastocatellia bacterium]
MAVYKRGGHWHFTKTINGVRYRGAFKTARTKAQAEEAERKTLNEIHEGTYGNTKAKETFKEFVDDIYIPWAKANKRSWKMDIYRLKAVLAFFGKRRLSEISPFDIERFKITRRDTPVVSKTKTKTRSVAAVNRELRLLSRILKLAVTNHKLAESPFRHVELFKGEQARTRYLLPDEEERLMAVLAGRNACLRSIVIMAINTGMRISELLGLHTDDVDFHRDVIYVKETKTDEDREVPMNITVRELMRKLVDQSHERENEYLFTNPKTGTRYKDIKAAWHNACRRAGIDNLRIHDLRHTFGTRAADAGVALVAIGKVMGHASIQTTMRYAHATDEGKRRAVQALERKPAEKVTNRSQLKAVGE